ncbi:MAG: hypothetical protein ABL949_13750 [Fimbriimonadaceae bacterium]
MLSPLVALLALVGGYQDNFPDVPVDYLPNRLSMTQLAMTKLAESGILAPMTLAEAKNYDGLSQPKQIALGTRAATFATSNLFVLVGLAEYREGGWEIARWDDTKRLKAAMNLAADIKRLCSWREKELHASGLDLEKLKAKIKQAHDMIPKIIEIEAHRYVPDTPENHHLV